MKSISDIPHLDGVKVLVRVDFNVPIQNGKVVDDFRIVSSLETIRFLLEKKAKVILLAHLEATDGSNPSLEPVARHLNELDIPTRFISNMRGAYEVIDRQVKGGECVLLENLRFFDGEKKNDAGFAKELASLGDIFINDAFSVCHREHASIVGVPGILPGYAGIQLGREVANLSRAFDPVHPFIFIIGGAKFDTKLPLIERFSRSADTIFIGGALANDILKAKGHPVGISKVSDNQGDIKKIVADSKVMAPVDVIVQDHKEKSISDVGDDDKILDAGSETIKVLAEKISQAKFVLWNGPLGLYEDGYQGSTLELAKLIAEKGKSDPKFISIVGGGDTVAAIASLELENSFTFISTGGGAMLDFLAQGTLPGIEALK